MVHDSDGTIFYQVTSNTHSQNTNTVNLLMEQIKIEIIFAACQCHPVRRF